METQGSVFVTFLSDIPTRDCFIAVLRTDALSTLPRHPRIHWLVPIFGSLQYQLIS